MTEEITYPREVTMEEVARLAESERRTGSLTVHYGQGHPMRVVWRQQKKKQFLLAAED